MAKKLFLGLILFVAVIQVISQQKADEEKKAESERLSKMSPAEIVAERKLKAEARAVELAEKEMSGAKYACHEFVLSSLHDPKSAELEKGYRHPIEKLKDGSYRVQVSGQARNGFNAMRMISVNCTTRLAGDRWVALKLQQLE